MYSKKILGYLLSIICVGAMVKWILSSAYGHQEDLWHGKQSLLYARVTELKFNPSDPESTSLPVCDVLRVAHRTD